MGNNKLIITWKPDVLTNVVHIGKKFNGLTSRSEVESFNNIKTKEAAQRILNSRNTGNIIVAMYNNEVLFPQ